jgi:hypothetical protein
VLIAVGLVIVAGLAVREAFATANLTSQRDAREAAELSNCASLPSHSSLHTEIVKETGTRLT